MLQDPRFSSTLVTERMESAREKAAAAHQRFNRMKPSFRIAFIMVGVLVLWLLSGLIIGGGTKTPAPEEGIAQVASVSIIQSRAEPKVRNLKLLGVTEPRRTINLKAEAEGLVKELNVKEGAFVRKGDVIITIEERDKRERVAEAQAVLKQREAEYKAAAALSKKGYQADVELKRSAANLAAARTQAKQAEVELEHTRVRAPFDGVVDRIYVEKGDLVGPNEGGPQNDDNSGPGVALLVERTPMLVVGQVAERVVKDVTVGMPATVNLINGEIAEGEVTYLSTMGEPSTRSFRIEVEVPNGDGRLKAGMTSQIIIPADMEKAHFVSSSALSLDDTGRVGVKVLEPKAKEADGSIKGVVKFHPIELSEDNADGVWVTGLPDTAYIITLGQAFVKEKAEVLGKLQAPVPAGTSGDGKAD